MLPVRKPRTLERSAGSSSRAAYAASGSSGRKVRAQDSGDRAQREPAARVIAADERQLEPELVEPILPAHVPQPEAADERPERRLDRRPQPADRVGHAPSSSRRRARTQLDLLRQRSRRGPSASKSVASNTRCTSVPNCTPTGRSRIGEGGVEAGRRCSAGRDGRNRRRRARLVAEARLLRLAGDELLVRGRR